MLETQLSSEAAAASDIKKLPLMELFGPTIQGEGVVIGQQTFFIRLGLCDYKCTMCDSMHAVDGKLVSENATWLTQKELAEKFFKHAKPNQTHWVTLSGGNPAIHELNDLINRLRARGYKIAVETQGTFAPDWLKRCDIVTCSPKGPGMGERFDHTVFQKFIYHIPHTRLFVKMVIFDDRDIEFASKVTEMLKRHHFPISHIYLSQGNPYPPGAPQLPPEGRVLPLVDYLRAQYLVTFEKLKNHKTLSSLKWLPQWHVQLWGNQKGV